MLGEWLAEFVDIREEVNTQPMTDLESYRRICAKISDRIKLTGIVYLQRRLLLCYELTGRRYPIPYKLKEAHGDRTPVDATVGIL